MKGVRYEKRLNNGWKEQFPVSTLVRVLGLTVTVMGMFIAFQLFTKEQFNRGLMVSFSATEVRMRAELSCLRHGIRVTRDFRFLFDRSMSHLVGGNELETR